MQEGILRIVNSKSKTFLAFCSLFVLASGSLSLIEVPSGLSIYFYFLIFIITALAIIFWDIMANRFLVLSTLFLILGFWRYAATIPNCKNASSLCYYNSNKTVFVGIVSGEPIEKSEFTNYIISGKELSGKVMVRSGRFPALKYGDEVRVSCKLEKPENYDEVFKYDKYLARLGVHSICNYPELIKITEGKGNFLLSKIYLLKDKLSERLSQLWPEPEGSLMAGLLYGNKSSLPKYVSDNFSTTGVSHLVAVSGFNITVIVVALMSLFVYVGIYRQHAFYLVIAITAAFVVLTGLSASAVRAGIMGTLVLIARQVGRRSEIFNLLIFTLALMQAFNPYFLLWDVGFQLSFLATMGLVYISPVLEKCKIPKFIAPTFAAIISTLPLILYQFGTLSLVAPLTNILILWLIPWVMLGGFISILGSYLFIPLGSFLAFLTHIGLSYVIIVVEFFGTKSWSSLQFQVPLWLMLAMYGGLLFFWKKLYGQIKN